MTLVRPATLDDVPAITQVHISSWMTSYRGMVPDSFLDAMPASAPQRQERWAEWIANPQAGSYFLAAEHPQDGVVGFSSGGAYRDNENAQLPRAYAGEVYTLYLLETHKRQGIGRALMQGAFEALVAANLTSMILWVLAENAAARQFYESLGGELVIEKPFELAGVQIPEVGYGWDDLTAVL